MTVLYKLLDMHVLPCVSASWGMGVTPASYPGFARSCSAELSEQATETRSVQLQRGALPLFVGKFVLLLDTFCLFVSLLNV